MMKKKAKKSASKKKLVVAKKLVKKPAIAQKKGPISEPYREIKQQLVKMKDDLLQHIQKTAKKERYSLKREVGDLYDQAYSDRERELTLLLGDIESQKLKEINDAIFRIDRHEYGACETCQTTIPLARLRIMPFARMCVTCQSSLESEMGEAKRRETAESALHISRGKVEEEEA